MPIPPVSADKISAAMDRFDSELRADSQWINWESNQAHRYAIKRGDKLYPVKQVIAMASGVSVGSFAGGSQANDYLKGRGFEIVPLRATEHPVHMPTDDDDSDYESKQRQAIEAWQASPPSVVEKTLGFVFKPLGWAIQKIVPPSAIEGALRSADWLAQQTIAEKWIFSKSGINNVHDLKYRRLRELDELADSFHRWQRGYAVAEGAAAGAAGLPGLAVDIPLLITLTLRTVRGIGVCYGYNSDTETEREFVSGVIATAGASSMTEKNAAILLLRKLEVTLMRQTFKKMAEKAAQQAVSQEAAIIALRDLARQLGVNLTKRKMLQAVPFLGAGIGAAVNWKFMDDIAWAARRSYQERWLQDRAGSPD
jgi:uncharacterized protein (DUF697 family)